MPTFKNITVTISPTTAHPHLPSPLPEYGTLKQSRKSTITTYIPSSANVNFAISIVITSSYVTLTNSQNESLAAYVYFDGRTKEETATLLRRGQETWISSRWVEMPDKSLAEKEFVFKEVGLEVQLNGLGLDTKRENGGSKKKPKRAAVKKSVSDSKERSPSDVNLNDDGDDFRTNPRRHSMPASSALDDDDEEDDDDSGGKPTAGQIRVDLFRVLAEGPVKKGEYHPMFKEGEEDPESKEGGNGLADLEYTAGFSDAKPLDAESISTQSVSHIDQPSSPYATFIFFYRGERQLHRMGIIPKPPRGTGLGLNPRPRSKTLLESISGKEYTGKGKGKGWDDFRDRDRMMDEDEDIENRNGFVENVIEEEEEVETNGTGGAEGETLSEGVRKMKLKRGFAEDPDEARTNTSVTPATPQSTPHKPSSSSALSPFAGSSRHSNPHNRRNGAPLSSPPFSNGGLNGLTSSKSTKFGNGLGGLRSGITSSIAGLSNGLSSNGFVGSTNGGSGSTSTSDEDKYTPKKRRQSRQMVDEEIL